MEVKEALKRITKEPKWYAISEDESVQIWLIMTAKRIEKGTSKQLTLNKFFNHFGYEIKTNVIKVR